MCPIARVDKNVHRTRVHYRHCSDETTARYLTSCCKILFVKYFPRDLPQIRVEQEARSSVRVARLHVQNFSKRYIV